MTYNKINSPYSAGLTGCGFMQEEMTNVLPLLMQPNADELLRQEVVQNKYLAIRTETTRSRAVAEFKRRYSSMPKTFWEDYLNMSPSAQQVAMFFVILKTYRIAFDWQVDVVVKRWISVSQSLTKMDLLNHFNEISLRDEFVASWTDNTKSKVAAAYMAILKKIGMLNEKTGQLSSLCLTDEEWSYYIQIGESWFLDACLLQPYEVERIKQYAL